MPDLLTAREIVTFYAKLRGVSKNRINTVLEFASLENDADRLTREYSGGMLQRLGLAIALLGDTEILALDEPTLNLDPSGVDRFRDLIREFKKRGKTIIFSSHILQDAAHLADRVGVMANGRLARVASVPDFKENIVQETLIRVILEDPIENIQVSWTRQGRN